MTSSFVRDDSLKLGDKAKDRITNLTGTVIAITEWLNGCRRITIQPSELHEGRPVDSCTFDAEQIVKLQEGPKEVAQKTGGPSIAPQQRNDPR